MNTRLVSLLALVAAVTTAGAGEPPAPPCCPAPAATPACCAADPAAAAKPAVASCCDEIKPAAPLTARSLYQLDAKWTDDSGRTVALTAWRGRPVVLAMIFASCEYACPVLVQDIRRLREALPEEARARTQIVLVSFDVARDTPAALKAFRERMNLDANWTLLRGETMPVQDLAMLLGVKYKQDARGQFAHSNLFTVLNSEGEVIHQHAGLMGDISEAAKAVAQVAR
jgi:protein SCO1/2